MDEIKLPMLRLSIGFMGGSDTLTIKASGPLWSASCAAQWVELKKLNDTSLVVISTPNISANNRTDNIEFELGNTTKTLFVIQDGVPSGHVEHTIDSLALIALYNACGGKQWYYLETKNDRPWPLEKPFSQWHGVGVVSDGGQTRVSSLDLTALGVDGSLPAQMADLTRLRNLSLSGGNLTGTPMDILSQLSALETLDLSYNYSADVRTASNIGSLSNLISLNLSGINMEGSYPTYLDNMPNLIVLSMAGCNLQGDVDASIRKMVNLIRLDLSDNPMQAAFPQWITELTNLQELNLSLCALTGSLPADLGGLKHLTQLKLGVNSIDGTIPFSIGQLTELEILNLSENRLTAIDDQISQCRSLKFIDISFNSIASLTPQIGLLSNLEQLFAAGNQITAIDESIFDAHSLKIVDLSYNKIEGELSPQWGTMGKLEMLMLTKNNLRGNIPVEILNARKLEKLVINVNRMSGTIASAITNDVRFKTIPAQGDYGSPTSGIWNPKIYICPQQEGYGFTNCDYDKPIDWNDEDSGGYIGRR